MPHFLAQYNCSRCGKPVAFMISGTILVMDAECQGCGTVNQMAVNPIPILSEGQAYLYCLECGERHKEQLPRGTVEIRLGKGRVGG